MSRYSVYSGLCGLYFIKDEKYNLPKEEYHIPLIIQDKSFYEDGYLINNETYLNPHNIITKVGFTFIWEFINLCDDVYVYIYI